MNRFEEVLTSHGLSLRRAAVETLQINVGRQCNQTCLHCHVEAGPLRTETMSRTTACRIGQWIITHRPSIVDITGGAPELSDFFQYLVETAKYAGAHVIDRCNLTIIEEDGFHDLPQYLAEHEVEVVASLPCYSKDNVAAQRGNEVFEKSITALRKLNAAGYGSRWPLHLVYNPVGPVLPGPQSELETDYRSVLKNEYGIVFNRLFTITNQPIGRFAATLKQQDQLKGYIDLLASNFNPATVEGLMCRRTLNVGWRGEVYDCDFNQMLGLQLANGAPLFLWDITPESLSDSAIKTGVHCFACTAGCGSTCTGQPTSEAYGKSR